MAKSIQLFNGSNMPSVGLGTFRLTGYDSIFNSLDAALGCGYRFIDTSQAYTNEADIGRALSILMPKYGLERKDLFITSKLYTQNMKTEKVRPSVEQTLKDLGTDYVDLFLIHHARPQWCDAQDPQCKVGRRESWLEMEKLHSESKLRAIGVSNFELRHLDEMATYATIQPAVNQCEFHPHYARRDFVTEIQRRGIHFQAFASLGRNNPALVTEPLLVQLAEKYRVPVTHILLAWPLALGMSILPKSANPERVKDNFEATKVKMEQEDVEKIWGLHKSVNYTLCRPWEVV